MTNTKVYTPDLGNTEMEFADHLTLPPVALEILQAIVRLMAFDKQNNTFRFLKSDELGNLRVTVAQPGGFVNTQSLVTVSPTPDTQVSEQPTRRLLVIHNDSPVRIFYRYDANLNGFGSFYLDPGDTLYEDVYTGAVTMETTAHTVQVRVFQLTTQFVT